MTTDYLTHGMSLFEAAERKLVRGPSGRPLGIVSIGNLVRKGYAPAWAPDRRIFLRAARTPGGWRMLPEWIDEYHAELRRVLLETCSVTTKVTTGAAT